MEKSMENRVFRRYYRIRKSYWTNKFVNEDGTVTTSPITMTKRTEIVPRGLITAKFGSNDKSIVIGYSLAHKNDHFCRKNAFDLASRRMEAATDQHRDAYIVNDIFNRDLVLSTKHKIPQTLHSVFENIIHDMQIKYNNAINATKTS